MMLTFADSLSLLPTSPKAMGGMGLLLFIFLLSLPLPGLSFRVSQMGPKDGQSPLTFTLMKRNNEVHRCNLHCQECRTIFGYMRYNYVDCVHACRKSDGSNWDDQCDVFRAEDKRTTAQEQQIKDCHQKCDTLKETQGCKQVRFFIRLVSTIMCKQYCKSMEFQKAFRLSCESVKRKDEAMFRIID